MSSTERFNCVYSVLQYDDALWECLSFSTFPYIVSLAADASTVPAAYSLLWFILDTYGKTFNTSQATFFTAAPPPNTPDSNYQLAIELC